MADDNSHPEYIKLSTGRFVGTESIVGISRDLRIYQGYDDAIHPDWNPDPWTKEELIELADFIIDRWRRFKEQVNE